jgi:glycosyltransferase involved in cell wall biosynthesis
MTVALYHRKPFPGNFSIERVFAAVCEALPRDIETKAWSCRFHRGLFRRVWNLLEAPFRQGSINHIVGDVHYLALALPGRRTILTVHDCVQARGASGLRRLALVLLWYRLPVKRCVGVTVISEFTKRELLKHVRCDPGRITVIYDPVSPQFVPYAKPFNAQCPVILQVGTGHNKNVLRVAEALDGLRCHLDVIGRLSEEQREALNRHQVAYTESWDLSSEEIVDRYRHCDIVLFASIYEGFGLPIVEANATGRPVITSDAGPMPEVAGSAACLVDPLNVSSIRNGILRVIEDEGYRDELIARGFENAKRFSADLIAEQYAVLYREVFSRRL